jgi:hypothetical protein
VSVGSFTTARSPASPATPDSPATMAACAGAPRYSKRIHSTAALSSTARKNSAPLQRIGHATRETSPQARPAIRVCRSPFADVGRPHAAD